MGGKGSGRRSARIERRAIKLEAMAIDHAIETYEAGKDRDKLELTKAIAPKVIRDEKSKVPERRNIVITFVDKPTAQIPHAPQIIDITPAPEPPRSTPSPGTIPHNVSSQPLPIDLPQLPEAKDEGA